MKPFVTWAALLAVSVVLTACNLGGGADRGSPDRTKTGSIAPSAAVSGGPHPRMPTGFSVAQGPRGVTELSVSDVGDDGLLFAYVTDATPRDVARFYEQQALAAGMIVTARMSAPELNAVNARRDTGAPQTIAVNATQKGELTNVTVAFGGS